MAVYRTAGDERLYNLAFDFYGETSDRAMLSIIIANLHTILEGGWPGEGRLPPRVDVVIPDNIIQHEYGGDMPPYYEAIKAGFDGDVDIPTPVNAGFTTNISPVDGSAISEDEAIRHAIIDALLSYRPERWMRREYGTKMVDVVKYPALETLGPEFVTVARRKLAEYSDRFRLHHVSGELKAERDRYGRLHQYLNGVVVAYRPFSNEPIRVEVNISLA